MSPCPLFLPFLGEGKQRGFYLLVKPKGQREGEIIREPLLIMYLPLFPHIIWMME